MTAPLCIGVDCQKPTPLARTGSASGRRGERVIDGVRWQWFCSRVCACRDVGLRVKADGRLERFAEASAQGRRDRALRLWQERVKGDVDTLMRHGVPRAIAQAVLVRVAQDADRRGAQRNRVKYQRKVAA